jgi:transcriptional regulator with XRE-family HTH domain
LTNKTRGSILYLNVADRQHGKGVEIMVNTREIKAQMQRKGMTQRDLALAIGINPATLNRKINNESGDLITVKEATEITRILDIPEDTIGEIFFA